MKSRLLTATFEDAESQEAKSFGRHFNEFLKLSLSDVLSCLEVLSAIKFGVTKSQGNRILNDLSVKTGQSRQLVESAIGVLNLLTEALVNESLPKDDYIFWTEDLYERGWLTKDQEEHWGLILNLLVEEWRPRLKAEDRKVSAREGVLPTFKSMGYTVDARPIRSGVYRWGTPVDEHNPEILGSVILASVHLGVDVGPCKDIYFQVDAEDVKNIIGTFQAIEKEMGLLGNHLNGLVK